MEFYFDGTASLKGVIGGVPYPLVWIDLGGSDRLARAEDKLSGKKPIPSSDIVIYCEEFIIKNRPRIIRPYIGEDRDPRFAAVPSEHAKRLDALRVYLSNEAGRERELANSEELGNQGGSDVPAGALDKLVNALVTLDTAQENGAKPDWADKLRIKKRRSTRGRTRVRVTKSGGSRPKKS